jgi:hypothetical protein
MWVYAAISGVVAYAIYKERQALGCPTIPDGTDCDNSNGKAVRGTRPSPNESNEVIFSKIKQASDFADRWVTWRIALLASVPCTGFIYFFLYRRMPSEQELLVNMFVITAVMYFVFNFYKFHLIDHARNNIMDGVDIISARC